MDKLLIRGCGFGVSPVLHSHLPSMSPTYIHSCMSERCIEARWESMTVCIRFNAVHGPYSLSDLFSFFLVEWGCFAKSFTSPFFCLTFSFISSTSFIHSLILLALLNTIELCRYPNSTETNFPEHIKLKCSANSFFFAVCLPKKMRRKRTIRMIGSAKCHTSCWPQHASLLQLVSWKILYPNLLIKMMVEFFL